MVFGCFIGDTYCKTSVVHEYRVDTFLKTLGKGLRGSWFFCSNFIRASRLFSKMFLLHRPCHMINFALSLRLVHMAIWYSVNGFIRINLIHIHSEANFDSQGGFFNGDSQTHE